MDKRAFAEFYLHSNPPRIGVHFNESVFHADDRILIMKAGMPFRELLRYHTPWHHKGGAICDRFETVRVDPEYRSIRLQDVLQFPEKLKRMQGRPAVPPSSLWDVPVARDTLLRESLILDSNRTLAGLLQASKHLDFTVHVVEIGGPDMKRIIPDFEIISRRS